MQARTSTRRCCTGSPGPKRPASLDGALFTSSLTVEHFLAAADERGIRGDAIAGLADAVVAVIGDPTAETARSYGLTVDVVPAQASFEALARDAVAAASENQ